MSKKPDAFDTLISRISKSATAVRNDIQEALILSAVQAFEHGSDAKMIRTFVAAGAGARLKAMRIWCGALAPIYFKDGAPKFSKDARKRLREQFATVTEYEIYLREHQAWYEVAESDDEKQPKAYETASFLRGEVAHLDAAIKKANKNADDDAVTILTEARAVIADIIAKAENVALFLNKREEVVEQE